MEAHYLPLFDRVTTSGQADAGYLSTLYGLDSISHVPNAVRIPHSPSRNEEKKHDLLFVGNLSYRPNVDAAVWLCRDVLPHLPGATVAVVGRDPTPAVRGLAEPVRVTVAASVPDASPWYTAARVAVIPLLAAGGTRIKLLEAFAHRLPVVSTTVGAEGLDLDRTDGPVVTADTPEAFAAACRALLDDPDEAARRTADGEARVRASYTVDVVARSIAALLGRNARASTV